MRLSNLIILSLAPFALSNSLPNIGPQPIPEHHALHEIRQAIPPIAGLPEPIGSIVNSVLALLSSLLQTLTTGLDPSAVPTGLLGNFTDAIAALKGPLPGVPGLPLPVTGIPGQDVPLPADVPEVLDGGIPLPPLGDSPAPDLPLPDLPSSDLPLPTLPALGGGGGDLPLPLPTETPDSPLPDLTIPDLTNPDLPSEELPAPDISTPDLPVPVLPDLPVKGEGTQYEEDTTTANASASEDDPFTDHSPTAESLVPIGTRVATTVDSTPIATDSFSVPIITAPAVSDPNPSVELQQISTLSDIPQLSGTRVATQDSSATGFETSFIDPTKPSETSDSPRETAGLPETSGMLAAGVSANDLLATDAFDDFQVSAPTPTSTTPAAQRFRHRRSG